MWWVSLRGAKYTASFSISGFLLRGWLLLLMVLVLVYWDYQDEYIGILKETVEILIKDWHGVLYLVFESQSNIPDERPNISIG